MKRPQSLELQSLIDSGLKALISEIDADHKDTIPSGDEFTDRVLKDESGKPVINELVHREFHWFIEEAREEGCQRIMVLGAFLLGKCFVEGELIDIIRVGEVLQDRKYVAIDEVKYVPIEEVRAKDIILTVNGTSTKRVELAKDAFFTGRQDCYEIKFISGRSQRVSYQHPFLVENGVWVEAQDLEIEDNVKLRSSPFGDRKHKARDAWFLGLYIGDGSYGKISNGDDLVHANLEKLGTVTHCDFSDYYLHGTGKLLRQFEIHDRQPKVFPSCVFSFARGSLAHFLAGYFDADGTVSIMKHRAAMIELYSVNREWLSHVQNLLLQFGIGSHIRRKKGRYKGEEHLSWRLSIWRKADLEKFKKCIPLRSRKKEKLDEVKGKYIDSPEKWDTDGWLYDTITEVNYIGEYNTYGIEVPGTHIHVVNGLVSHNTEQLAIGWPLELVAKNTDIRIKIVSNTDDFATDRVRSVRRYIDNDEDFHHLAPHVKKTRIWGDSKFIVSRKGASKDATMEAFGMFGTATGSRAEVIIFDDPQDLRTAVLEPTSREKCISVIENVWLPRLTEDGIALILMNRWHEQDVPNWVKNNPRWAWMEIAISEDYKTLEITKSIKGVRESYSVPSWKPAAFYQSLRSDMGERNYNRSCRLIPFSDNELYFPSFQKCCIYGHDRRDFAESFMKKKDCLVVAGIDYSSAKRPGTVLLTVAMDRKTKKRVPIDLVALRDPAKLPEHMVRVWREYGVDLFMAENNATQSVINDLLLNFAGYGTLPIEGFHTGKNKADPDLGIISLEKEFENNMWTFAFPFKPLVEHEKTDMWTRFFFEVRDYPFWTTQDMAMALWFCREGINFVTMRMLQPRIW